MNKRDKNSVYRVRHIRRYGERGNTVFSRLVAAKKRHFVLGWL